jgi:DNA-binding NarL/FixJ family response regulator
VDDHPIVREGLALHLAKLSHLQICGSAEDVEHAFEQISELAPDLALVDLSLKNGNGIELVKRLKARNPSLRILVCSMHAENIYAERALHAGAQGYIEKSSGIEKIISAIEAVLAGKVHCSEALAARLLGQLGSHDGKTPMDATAKLTDRELEVFELLGHGMKTQQIALKMHINPKTVETYRTRIKEKLGLHNSCELVFHAIQWVLNKGNPTAQVAPALQPIR